MNRIDLSPRNLHLKPAGRGAGARVPAGLRFKPSADYTSAID